MVPSVEVSMVPESPTVTNNPVEVELSVLVVLSVLLQEIMVRLKTNIERMMSRCFMVYSEKLKLTWENNVLFPPK